MPHFILLTKLTSDGVKTIKNNPDRIAEVNREMEQIGLTVHSVDPERNLLLVKGAVPGPKNGLVEIREDIR